MIEAIKNKNINSPLFNDDESLYIPLNKYSSLTKAEKEIIKNRGIIFHESNIDKYKMCTQYNYFFFCFW